MNLSLQFKIDAFTLLRETPIHVNYSAIRRRKQFDLADYSISGRLMKLGGGGGMGSSYTVQSVPIK